MLHYILQSIVFQLLFLAVYDLFLRRETFFNWNRAYLLGTALLSIVLPFIKINSFKTIIPQNFVEILPTTLIGEQNSLLNQQTSNIMYANTSGLSSLEWILYIGVSVAALLFFVKLMRLFLLINKNPKQWQGNLLLIKLLNSNAAFSFFHYIFLGEQIKEKERTTILNHETVHAKQRHTLDLLLFEVLRILFWCNPLVYLYQSRMMSLHEFIADAKTIALTDKQDYYQSLLSRIFDTKKISFTNTFYKSSLIKNRIIMLNKTQSNRILKLKYLLLIPIVFGILLYTSCESETMQMETTQIEKLPFANIVVNLDSRNTSEFKELRNQQQDFLYNNNNFVQWNFTNHDKGTITYSIHKESEQVPKGYGKATMVMRKGAEEKALTSYFKSIGDPPNTVYLSLQKENP